MFTIKNITDQMQGISNSLVLHPKEEKVVTFVDEYILKAVADGLITVTPSVSPVKQITDNSGGNSTGDEIAAVVDVPTAANAIATLTENVNTLIALYKKALEDRLK